MDALGFIFGIVGMTFGMQGLARAKSAMSKIAELEKQLKEAGVLDKDYKSDDDG